MSDFAKVMGRRHQGVIALALLLAVLPQGAVAAAKPSNAYCRKASGVDMVDLATPVTNAFLAEMAKVGVGTIARYYDYDRDALPAKTLPDQPKIGETLTGKRLRVEEIPLLKAHGMKLLVVFQHYNDHRSTFLNWKARGPADAKAALFWASKFQQPDGSAIYFGVDGDFVGPSAPAGAYLNKEVASYFTLVKATLQQSGRKLKIGVYGSGATCKLLKSQGLVDYCWLANSHGFVGTKQALRDGAYDMEQYLPGRCGGLGIDFDRKRVTGADVGDFAPR